MIERIACKLNRNDENPNIELAVYLCDHDDKDGVEEIINGLGDKEQAVVNDCIKVIYEIGYRKPEHIAAYADVFISNLLSKNNRLAWGSMIALSTIAEISADKIFPRLNVIKAAYQAGSVITADNCISVFAKLCKAKKKYEPEIFPLILEHLKSCRPKEVPQHAERAMICINETNAIEFVEILNHRKSSLTPSQVKRIEKVIKTVQ